MTSATDATRHPDIAEISDLTEGLLSSSRAADVRSHLDGCEPCADVHASLEEIRELLGTLPAPEPMPTDIADRIDAALADEALSRRTEAGPAPDVSRETGSAVIAPDVADRPTGHARAAMGPGRRPVRRRRRTKALAAIGAAAVVGVSVLLMQNVQLPGSHDDATSAADTGASASRVFTQSTLEDRVYGLLGSSEDSASPQYSNGESSGAKEQAPSADTKSSPNAQSENPLRAPAVSVPSCVAQGIGRNTAALAIDKGTYEGTAAFLVVLPHPTDASRVQAYVVDATCVDAEPPAKGKLLLTHAYARP
ncbi:zf-HC2 domain-containing protein [Streptomyces sp. ITFR-16]|uniref:anti-sigma factor family protein n=1 Tax=Streptomyces sp. ITFR-16 TaxID=3075198 RepID=UPI00288A9DC0|nr:zf-HC2 domain-containing protein [Streptomyces sp. ITFR-16]WNI23687.1 hypothetical protein RLT58_17945 [Streptomyces sp. ITFR-16]